MTDNEIIKAFKDFLNEQVDGYTDHIETGGERYEFIEKELELLKETDNLINRQKAENERLTNKVEELSEVLSDTIRIRYAEAKAEAIKEFAERLKEKLHLNGVVMGSNCAIVEDTDIDNLLKEMVGDNNA